MAGAESSSSIWSQLTDQHKVTAAQAGEDRDKTQVKIVTRHRSSQRAFDVYRESSRRSSVRSRAPWIRQEYTTEQIYTT